MTNFTQDEIKAALTSIADGSTTECRERDDKGIFKHLHTEKYITGTNAGLNGFQLTNLALSPTGKQFLKS